MTDDQNQTGSDSFADLLDQYSPEAGSPLRVGEKVKGSVVAMDESSVFIATGSKVDGVIDAEELKDKEGNVTCAVGDELDLYVVAITQGEVRLSRSAGSAGSAMALTEAFENGVPVEGKVTAQCKGGFNVEVMQRRAFCPVSQIDSRFVENPEEYLGQTFQFMITRCENNGRNVVVSRRVLLEAQQEESRKEYMKTLNEGDVVDVCITRLTNFGAFAELAPGVEGLIHISELGWARVQSADEAVTQGDTLRAKVLKIESTAKGLRIALSAKQVMEDPWNTVADRLAAGTVVEGKVVRCTPFGAFVEVLPGIEGLVHISEMSWTRRILKAEDVVIPGDTVSVKIKDIDSAKRRISLSLREAEGDPWDGAAEKFAPGTEVTGTVEKCAKFGMFVNIAPGITGLLPQSRISAAPKSGLAGCKPGDTVTLAVMEINPAERKVTLTTKDAARQEDAEIPASYRVQPKSSQGGGFGTLGQALKDALNKK
ncbi:RNA binding S1 domain protein [Oleidesulfovibrio alaskensis G20]|jgi:small subunit ribosomal protein S1|uniref:RNA binding S1 domain protein n=1 Tax=Oleidesulfovibrio alaskensis (strain ATCC BAA-1058 / DSM 17464 / G20) TaxID=207559 RepID=Q30ZT8_OLEA2|nr:30S ribosomal protein S1 [Oleidesulfovibrio alaskensis]ABB38808.1 RNA binding S1 domain protein [Oleidesulfovibrio alaskensis G20]MBG0773111.1 30S ribosomal protein S1 [Oleidesulfovibrio alaskensis]